MDTKYQDPDFKLWIAEVSPLYNGKQQVFFLPTLLTVLELLWQLYQILHKKNVLARWAFNRKIRRAMVVSILPSDKQKALEKILGGLSPRGLK